MSDGIVEIWNLKEMTRQRVKLADKGSCAQIFYNHDLQCLTVVIFNSHYSEDKHTSIFQIQLPSLQFKLVFTGNVVLSKNQQGAFLGRQINYVNKIEKDTFFNSAFKNSLERRLGHYDLFNHYIRIDNHKHFFALIGNPAEQHTHKELIEIEPEQGRVIDRYRIDPSQGHYMNLNAILSGDWFVFQAKIYNSNPTNRKYILFAINRLTKTTEWLTDLPTQVSAFCTSIHHHQIIASLTNGDVIIFDIVSGRLIQRLERSNQYGFPLSLARHNEILAIGYDDGTVEMLSL
ncbi:hypothetical protein [Chania multitudinisentens]|uniref:hypothetical protein n=1 Tax=Chania multitudinisentens TaxID=1639108 RepID=UPI0012DC5D8B|nr:hypothetical protein [Chania multitudinisentens]